MDFQAIIAKRRDGQTHARAELEQLAQGAAKGRIPDYQLSAWLMAAYLNPLTSQETADLTLAMANSGERLDLTGLPKPWVDKHSTGGVGDKTSIVLLPLLAACGLTVIKMSGRGLGITGGTVDKLGAIPGFRLDLSPDELKAQAKEIGLALTGQTPDLAPADKVLYALRDVTATVSSVPLIVSSILSKKIAGGAETIVLDVKCGSGAFMKTHEAALALARALSETGKACGLNIRLAITDMDQPLGAAVGNALEVAEALTVLNPAAAIVRDSPTERFRNLCLELAAHTLCAAGLARDQAAGVASAEAALSSGAARAKARAWFSAQGATVDVFATEFEPAPVRREILHDGQPGWVRRVDAATIGQAVVDLGGGRHKKDDVLDLRVGLVLDVGVGSRVEPGRRLATIYAGSESAADAAVAATRSAFEFTSQSFTPGPIVLDVL